MGCPAKKVCNRAAGSALLRDEPLVGAILAAVVRAVDIPVTLKMRTGWDPSNRNGQAVARMAEDAGIAALAIHGRTRADKYEGQAEYATIRAIKQSVSIPVFANGDIDSGAKARAVLEETGADGVMIGRAAQGQPWIFREIRHFLSTGSSLPAPDATEVRDIMLEHLEQLYAFYGEHAGVRVARKHLGWYRDHAMASHRDNMHCDARPGAEAILFSALRVAATIDSQQLLVREWFDAIGTDRPAARDQQESELLPRAPTGKRVRRHTEVA
jgi:tRNA-dihydrouridine synthase B